MNKKQVHTNSKSVNKNSKKTSVNSKSTTSSSKKVSKHKKLKRFFLILFIILIILIGFFTFKIYKNGWGLKGLMSTVLGRDEAELKDLSEIDFLLIGESGNMTDTIMACRYNPKAQSASIISVPRDTFIGDNEDKATASDKINSVYNRTNNPLKTVEAVNKVTGLNLKYYVFVDTTALKELVDAIGGVNFYVPIDMDYDDTSEENFLQIHLKEGQQTLNGSQAEQLVRFRHNNDGSTYPTEYGEQDIGRMKTQREFLSSVLKQTLKPGNIFKLKQILEIANKNVKTNIDSELIKDYIPYAVNFSTDSLETTTLPGTPEKLNGVWVYLTSSLEAQTLVNDLFYGGKIENSETTPITVQLLNGSSNSDVLLEVITLLENNGFDVIKVGNAASTSKTSIINRTKQTDSTLSKLQSLLNSSNKITTGKNNIDADISITIGKDYKK